MGFLGAGFLFCWGFLSVVFVWWFLFVVVVGEFFYVAGVCFVFFFVLPNPEFSLTKLGTATGKSENLGNV